MLTWNKNGLSDNLTSQVYEHSAFTNKVFMNLNEKKTQEVSSFLSIDWPQSTQYEQENVNIIGFILREGICKFIRMKRSIPILTSDFPDVIGFCRISDRVHNFPISAQ